ncbi:MAG: glutamine amidotransferase [Rhizobiales bacterium]|nr:glutamine amidotransferase [Hyphomicrobiales bacterium]
MKPFLILQLRPETEVSDDEYRAILEKSGLRQDEVRRIRLDMDPLPADLDLGAYAGTIVGGGPGCVSDAPEDKSPVERRMEAAVRSLMPAIVEGDLPFLGCCYGIGILAHHLGAPVSKARYSEGVGAVTCSMTADGKADRLLQGLPDTFSAFVGHKEAVQELPRGCRHLLSSAPCPYQMIRYGQNVYATQFHPEADGHVFELRIRYYKDKGYFMTTSADALIARCHQEDVRFPEYILQAFVDTYRAR